MRYSSIEKFGAIGLLAAVHLVVAGCNNSDVKLADVPQVTPTKAEPPKPPTRIPKNAQFSPPVLPGSGSK